MTLLSRKADYALLILSYLHQSGRGCAREIADHFGLSPSFVANILKELCQKGFVLSQRGVNGGYSLQRPAEEITLGELLASVEDGFHLAACNHQVTDENCSLTHICPIKGPMAIVHQRIMDVLNQVTLSELFPVMQVTPAGGIALPLLSVMS